MKYFSPVSKLAKYVVEFMFYTFCCAAPSRLSDIPFPALVGYEAVNASMVLSPSQLPRFPFALTCCGISKLKECMGG